MGLPNSAPCSPSRLLSQGSNELSLFQDCGIHDAVLGNFVFHLFRHASGVCGGVMPMSRVIDRRIFRSILATVTKQERERPANLIYFPRQHLVRDGISTRRINANVDIVDSHDGAVRTTLTHHTGFVGICISVIDFDSDTSMPESDFSA